MKEFVERYATLQKGHTSDEVVKIAYGHYVKEPLRAFARDEIQRLSGLEVKEKVSTIGEQILGRVLELTRDTPFEVKSVVVGNVQYPAEIAAAVSKKLAATQDLERKSTEIEITRREKDKRLIEAEGIAGAMSVINERLTPQYLQYEAIKAQRDMVGSPNHTTIYIPVGPMGVPLVEQLKGR